MARSQDSFNKKEKEKKRRKKKQEKLERKEQRKLEKAEGGTKTFEDMIMYVDEDGNLTSTPPDPAKKKKFKLEDMVIGVPPKDDAPMETVRKGRVKFFNDEKGYGFILDMETKESIFVHANNTSDQLRENDIVAFEVEMGPKGPNAINVSIFVEIPVAPEPVVKDPAKEDTKTEDATAEAKTEDVTDKAKSEDVTEAKPEVKIEDVTKTEAKTEAKTETKADEGSEK